VIQAKKEEKEAEKGNFVCVTGIKGKKGVGSGWWLAPRWNVTRGE